jgi:lipoprotein NlpI
MQVAVFVVAIFLLNSFAWSQPSSAELVKRGNDYLNKGEYAGAIEAYTGSIRLEPGSAKTFYARGYAYYRSHDEDRAIQDFSEAIRLEPGFGEAFRARGRAYEDKGDYERAIQDYTQAIRLKPADLTLLYDRAFDYERKGEYAPALLDLNEIVRRSPEAADGYRNRGLARLFSAQLSEAEQDLSRAVELRPSEHYNVIWLYIAQAKRGAGAEDELAKNASKLDLAKWPGPVIQLFLSKTSPEAVLQAAVDKDPRKNTEQRCEANFYIGERLAIHGQRSAAQEHFRLASKTCDKNYFLYGPATRAELVSKK